MHKLCYIVDDEPLFTQIMSSIMFIEGFDVLAFHNATDALDHIKSNPEESSSALFFIDMALEPGEKFSSFGEKDTYGYMLTGLVLAEKIIEENIVPAKKRENIILYTAHVTKSYWPLINQFCQTHGCRKWQKAANADMEEIINLAKDFIE